MKDFKLLVVVLLFAELGIGLSSAQSRSLTVPVEVQFLNRGNAPIEGQFFIRAGQVFTTDGAGGETPASLGHLDGSAGAGFTGSVETILGAPVAVFARREIEIPADLSNSKSTLRVAVRPDTTLFVQETRTLAPTDAKQVITEFVISQLVNGKLSGVGRFSFHENTFNQYLSEVWPISDAVLAIATKSSRHSRLSTLFMFDTKKRQVVGMREFSVLQYLPVTSSVWIAQSVANCDNIDEVFAEAKRNARVFQLFEKGEISHDFQALEGIDGDIAKQTESSSPDDPSSSSPPIASPKTVKKTPEPKPTTATPSEEPASSTPWSVIVILTAAALGLLWWLVKNRK